MSVSAQGTTGTDPTQRLVRVEALLGTGAITPEEYAHQRAAIISAI